MRLPVTIKLTSASIFALTAVLMKIPASPDGQVREAVKTGKDAAKSVLDFLLTPPAK